MTPPARVLVVDDNPTNVKLLRFLLEVREMSVVVAQNADEARRAAAEHRPSIILMDVQLPGVDGITLTKELRADPLHRTTPIIVITAYAMAREEAAAYAAGCDAFVTKPIDPSSLADLVQRFLDERPGAS